MADNQEIEVKFLEIDVPALHNKLVELGAEDLGEDHLTELVFYDKSLTWIQELDKRQRFVRLRKNRKGVFLTYKSITGNDAYAEELETTVDDIEAMAKILEAVGLVMSRQQEKKRHSYRLNEVMVDIDTWPKVPTYVELEGPSEQAIKDAAAQLGFDWDKGVFDTAHRMIEKRYGISMVKLKYFTFDKVE
jgi:adenylate cyclase class 2